MNYNKYAFLKNRNSAEAVMFPLLGFEHMIYMCCGIIFQYCKDPETRNWEVIGDGRTVNANYPPISFEYEVCKYTNKDTDSLFYYTIKYAATFIRDIVEDVGIDGPSILGQILTDRHYVGIPARNIVDRYGYEMLSDALTTYQKYRDYQARQDNYRLDEPRERYDKHNARYFEAIQEAFPKWFGNE